jgi:hypothetical protein
LIESYDVDCWAVQKAVADDGKNWFEEVSVCCAFGKQQNCFEDEAWRNKMLCDDSSFFVVEFSVFL